MVNNLNILQYFNITPNSLTDRKYLFPSAIFYNLCNVGQWFRRERHHAARQRLETPAAQTFSSTTGGFPALCHKPGRDDHSLWSKNKQHHDKSSNVTKSSGAEPVFAVLNVTLSSSALIESCLTTQLLSI